MGGGTNLKQCPVDTSAGLSPRGRGNLFKERIEDADSRSIPAWAGEPSPSRPANPRIAVYPRVGGGTIISGTGDSYNTGLSPRGRGNLLRRKVKRSIHGSIPAWAGEPSPNSVLAIDFRVYPRVGGGTPLQIITVPKELGLSPRGRGNRYHQRHSK